MDRTRKLVVLGDQRCGKTNFVNHLRGVGFTEEYNETVEVNCHRIAHGATEFVCVEGGARGPREGYLIDIDAGILILDVNTNGGGMNVINSIRELRRIRDREIPILVCANKSDMADHATIERFYRRWYTRIERLGLIDVHVVHVSARTGENIYLTMEFLLFWRRILATGFLSDEKVELFSRF